MSSESHSNYTDRQTFNSNSTIMDRQTKDSGRHCAFCLTFLSAEKRKICGGCKRRAYCSHDCQKADWSAGKQGQVHKNWCKLGCGEEDLDWEVVPVEGMGLGVIAKRLIPANYQIMIDPVRSMSHPRIQELMPLNGNLMGKVRVNGFTIDNNPIPFVCLRVSRINHGCDANAALHYDMTFKVAVVYARRDIQEGEEILLNYRPVDDIHCETQPEEEKQILRFKWGIECKDTCHCRNAEIQKLMEKARKLHASILALKSAGRVVEALEGYDELLELENSINSSYVSKSQTLFEAFMLSSLDKNTLQKAKGYIRRLYEIASTILASPSSVHALKFKRMMDLFVMLEIMAEA